jgi:hypothetical protein
MKNMEKKRKKGQATVFIILALVIVAIIALIYFFFPQIKSTIAGTTQNPNQYMQDCLEKDLSQTVELISLQGGSVNPENYVLYESNKIDHLCFTNEYYKQCVVQIPLLKEHIEKEIEKTIKQKAIQCEDALVESYKSKGYSVNLKNKTFITEVIPDRIVVSFSGLTLTGKDSKRYDSIRVVLNNNLYELLSITNSIIRWEASYGSAETTLYMNYFQNIKVEKKKQSSGSTVYILTERDTENKFQFASRSIVLPPGFE